MKRNFVNLALALVAALSFNVMTGTPALAATITSAASGNWNDTGTWVGGVIPSAADAVVIASGHMVTIPAGLTANATSITINANASGTQNGVTFAASSSTMVLTGAVTMNAPTNASDSLVAVDAGTLSGATTLSITGGSSGMDAIFRISTGTANFSGSATFLGTNAQAKLTFTGAGRLNIGGNFGASGTLTGGTGTINFDGSAAQTMGNYDTYNNVEINNTSGGVSTITGGVTIGGTLTVTTGTFNMVNTSTITGAVTVNSGGTLALGANTKDFNGNVTVNNGGTLTVSAGTSNFNGNVTVNNGGTFTAGGGSSTVTGATSVSGTLTVSSTSGAKAFGNLTINSSGTMSFTAAEAIDMNGNLENNGAFTGTTGLWTFQKSGGGGAISGSNNITLESATFTTAYDNSGIFTVNGTLTVTGAGIRLTNNSAISATTALSGTGGVTQGTTGTLNIGGTSTINTLTATASGNTVNYNKAGAQIVIATTYSNLTFSGSGAKSMATGTSVSGQLSIAPTGTATASVGTGLNLSVSTLLLGGVTQTNGTWGSTSSIATNTNNTYFAATTGYLTVSESWLSYNNAARTVADDSFGTGENTVYMFGAGFLNSHTYAVGYYDGTVSGGGLKVLSDSGLTSGTSGNLSSQYLLTTDFNSVAGTWHAVVFDSDLGEPSANYTTALSSPAYVRDHAFNVDAAAIPEFPTVIAAIMVAGSCFGLYWWRRRQSLKFKY